MRDSLNIFFDHAVLFWQGRAIAAAAVLGSHLCAYRCALVLRGSSFFTVQGIQNGCFVLSSVVVPAVYSEIEMVDPYITALAIVGGLTAFGLQVSRLESSSALQAEN